MERYIKLTKKNPAGDPWFEGETGDYWGDRMAELRDQPGGNEMHVSISKKLGWGW